MKAAVYHGKSVLKVDNVDDPVIGEDEVLVKISACGVCGTDLHIYSGDEGAATVTPPRILGHEFSGVICEVGKKTGSLKIGDRVCVDPNDMCGKCYYCQSGKAHFCENMIGYGTTVNGGFAQYCMVRGKQVYKIADSLSLEEAAMTEPVACCLHGMDLTGIKTGDTVMVIGGGSIGLIMLQLARISGASTLILVEPVDSKRELGLRLGADIAIDPLSESINEKLISMSIKHIDATIECVGLKNTMEDALKYVSRGGTAMMFGLTNPDCEIPLKPFDIFKREVSIKASFISPYTQKRALSLLESGRVRVKDIITDSINLDDIVEVFKDKSYRKKGKIIIRPQ